MRCWPHVGGKDMVPYYVGHWPLWAVAVDTDITVGAGLQTPTCGAWLETSFSHLPHGGLFRDYPPQSDFSVALIKSYQGPTSLTLSTRYFNKVEMMPTKFTQLQMLNKGNLALKKKRSFIWVHKCDTQPQLTLQWDADLKCKLFKLPQTCAHVSYSKAVTHTLQTHYSCVRHPLYTHWCCQRRNQSGKRLLHITDKSRYSQIPCFLAFKLCLKGNMLHRYYLCPWLPQMRVLLGGVSLKALALLTAAGC